MEKTTWFLFAPFLILIAVVSLLYAVSHDETKRAKNPYSANAVEFKALPQASSKISIEIKTKDARAEALEDFFRKFRSPLTPYAEYFVVAADENDLDFRLLPSIAMHESGLCKKIPKGSYNCFGYGIYGGKVLQFKGFDDAILKVSKAIAKEYIRKGYRTPQKIMEKYTPSSNGSWAESVSYYMDAIYTIL